MVEGDCRFLRIPTSKTLDILSAKSVSVDSMMQFNLSSVEC